MKRFFSICLMAVGVLVLLASAGALAFNQKVEHPGAATLPVSLSDLPLTSSTIADQAVTEFTRMHGNDFPVTSGAVGEYGPDNNATLWVAGAPFRYIAGQLLISMRDKIAGSPGRSPFTPVRERQDGRRTIYELDGMGQKHFYFQSGNLIVWLAVEPDKAEEILNQVLAFYP